MSTVMDSVFEALNIMLLGMGLVFAFLSLLIAGINIVARLVASEPVGQLTTVVPNNNDIEPQVVAAITAAIHQYRRQA
ncbi:OadG family protein [Shewanella marina]|uniref:OadG family protein n=1 Tax=Shewanella marina TaxID=487319 RepID=UPI000470CA26|nr:OadG family transporter subunit [Shewanella marina]